MSIKLVTQKVSFKKGSPKFVGNSFNILIVTEQNKKEATKWLKSSLLPWQKKTVDSIRPDSYRILDTKKGKVGLILVKDLENADSFGHDGLLDSSFYAKSRDLTGAIIRENQDEASSISLSSWDDSEELLIGSIVGIEMACYHFVNWKKFKSIQVTSPKIETKKGSLALKEATRISSSINMARVLVDTPPNFKKPGDYAKKLKDFFKEKKNLKIEIWDEKKLKKEKMGMMLSVGLGSDQGSHLVCIHYRPEDNKDRPIAFVGKGITFDAGGLDIKPPSGMRNMKKDMGGSAAIAGLLNWVVESKYEKPCSFYFALSENMLDDDSFRPSDVVTARNGMTVEIDNTDAEGRLVLGDALDVAVTQTKMNKPKMVIDIATLTGAVKVGLGSEVGGLFSNDDDLAFCLQSASAQSGDYLWRMPLLSSQRDKLTSDVADISNSASGFGGAIRAAMFLKEFVRDFSWAHLDIYAWSDEANKACSQRGGNGQGVQCLIHFLGLIKE